MSGTGTHKGVQLGFKMLPANAIFYSEKRITARYSRREFRSNVVDFVSAKASKNPTNQQISIRSA